ncbi:hypothetical protein Pmani_004032 [Petrolisthes manimaculis]|uniref:Uncharacterized protein n=1 Tax=Petrolisthes manimaculis TaxID=1843537 RepID=A0AAE1UIX2_9EUCA|nr:hypothetical protein Pmani_004032 [Petrolisthes manimaculis]
MHVGVEIDQTIRSFLAIYVCNLSSRRRVLAAQTRTPTLPMQINIGVTFKYGEAVERDVSSRHTKVALGGKLSGVPLNNRSRELVNTALLSWDRTGFSSGCALR